MLPQRIDAILYSIKHLRPMPSNVTRILKEIESPNITVGMISEYIGLDQALAALVLQLSNSTAMGYGRTCTSLHEAVMRIGLKRLKSILLASSAVDSMGQSLRGYRLGAGELWNHALATAVASEWLARQVRYPDPEEAYVSGLLHDIGKLLLDQFVLTDYSQIVDFIQKYRMPLWQVEEKLIGLDHARVGGLIGERWQFPPVLVDAISFHHYPSQARKNQQLPAIVNLANAIASRKEIQTGLFCDQIHPDTLAILQLSDHQLSRIREQLASVLVMDAA